MSIDKCGSVWIHPDRNMHGRATADVEIVYAVNPSSGFDFASVQSRVQMALSKGCDVYLRVDYEPGQSLPPDETSLQTYLGFIVQCVSDATVGRVKGLIAGNEPNCSNEWRVTGQPLTAEWVARVVYGYGKDPSDTSNVYQYALTYNPNVRVFAPAVGPWNTDTAGTMSYTPPNGRTQLSEWETYQYELAWKSYNNNYHAPFDQVSFSVHTYSRVGTDGTANGGAQEPWSGVTCSNGAYWGTQWLDDCEYAICQANGGASPPKIVGEWNCYTDAPPDQCYPAGLLQQVIAYVGFKPNVYALCQFVDQSYGNGWPQTSMTAEPSNIHIAAWNSDWDSVLQSGW